MKNQRKPKIEYMTTYLFLLVLLVFFIGTGFKVSVNLVDRLKERLSSQSTQMDEMGSTQQNNGNIEAVGVKNGNIATAEVKNSNIVTEIFTLINHGIVLVEKMYDESAIFRDELIYVNGGFQRVLNQKIVEDIDQTHTVYRLNNGQLTFQSDRTDMTENIEKVKDLYDIIRSKNMHFLYVQAPFKINKYDNKMPGGMEDTTNRNADDLLEGLRKNEVPFIDLRDVIDNSDMNYDDLFYHTDHHWKMETAFWAYGHVMNVLSDAYGLQYDTETTDLLNYQNITAKKSYLGSQGVRVGRLYGGVDDFTYFVPDFQTSYHVREFNMDGSMRIESTGDFQDAIIMKDIVDMNPQIKTTRYQAYFGGDHPFVAIENLEQESGKILIIKDSFARPFSAFMSLNFKETDVIDVRYFRSMTLYEHLESNQYDFVVILYNPSELNNDTLFAFKKGAAFYGD